MATKTEAIEASDVAEDVKELVEDAAEFVEARASWLSNPKMHILGATLVGVAFGGALTYLVVSKRLSAKYQKEADAQIEDVKNRYSVIHKNGTNLEELAAVHPESDRERAEDIITEQEYISYDQVETTAEAPESPVEEAISVTQAIIEATSGEITHHNVFESDDPTTYFNFREEQARRKAKPDLPHVITKDEFDNNDTDYDQATLTYYDGDDVLADQQDSPVDNIEAVMGYENLLRFGHGSGDPRIVYIRNPKLELDFEVVHSDGKFAKEVLGFDDELQHSHRRPQRKFRPSDE